MTPSTHFLLTWGHIPSLSLGLILPLGTEPAPGVEAGFQGCLQNPQSLCGPTVSAAGFTLAVSDTWWFPVPTRRAAGSSDEAKIVWAEGPTVGAVVSSHSGVSGPPWHHPGVGPGGSPVPRALELSPSPGQGTLLSSQLLRAPPILPQPSPPQGFGVKETQTQSLAGSLVCAL